MYFTRVNHKKFNFVAVVLQQIAIYSLFYFHLLASSILDIL